MCTSVLLCSPSTSGCENRTGLSLFALLVYGLSSIEEGLRRTWSIPVVWKLLLVSNYRNPL